ncbi:hypothetical protein HQ560_03735 [bacterium]|nr:hypothetical protein [bacterium]
MSDRPGRHRLLLLTCVTLLALAAAYEVLWMARHWEGSAASFSVRRLGLHLSLSARQFTLFSVGSALFASASVALSWFWVRRVTGAGGARWRHAVALGCLLCVSWPLYHAIGWAAGGLSWSAAYSGEWSGRQFVRELGLVATPRLFWLGGLIALAGYCVSTPSRWMAALSRAVARLGRAPRGAVAFGAVVAAFGLATLFLLVVFDGEPHYPDATAYRLMGRMFAAGETTLPVVGLREFHDPQMLPFSGRTYAFSGERWFCYGAPGAALFFSLGYVVGLPWLIPPLLGAALVALTGMAARELYGVSAGLVAMVLAALSPWLIFMSGEYLAHVPCAVVCLAFVLMAERAMSGSRASAAVAGFLLSLCACIRPQVAVPFAVPVAVAWGVWLVRKPREALVPTLLFLALSVVPMAGYLVYNASTTGHPLTFGYWFQGDPVVRAVRAAPTPWHWTPALGLSNLQHTLYGVGVAMFRWPVHVLGLLVGGLVALGLRVRPGRQRLAAILLVAAALVVIVHAFHSRVLIGLGGPRYGFETVPILIVFGAGLLTVIGKSLLARRGSRECALGALALPLLICLAYGTLATMGKSLPKLHRYLGIDGSVFRSIAARVEGPALVFVSVDESDESTQRFYAALGQNHPGLEGPIVYARDLGDRNAVLAQARPGRYAYRCDLATGGLEPLVVEGALPPTRRRDPGSR